MTSTDNDQERNSEGAGHLAVSAPPEPSACAAVLQNPALESDDERNESCDISSFYVNDNNDNNDNNDEEQQNENDDVKRDDTDSEVVDTDELHQQKQDKSDSDTSRPPFDEEFSVVGRRIHGNLDWRQSGSLRSDEATVTSRAINEESNAWRPWIEESWDQNASDYTKLRQLYTSYFERLNRKFLCGDHILIDFLFCNLDEFLTLGTSLSYFFFPIMTTYCRERPRFLTRNEFIRLMFYLSFAPKEQMEADLFKLTGADLNGSCIATSDLLHLLIFHFQRRLNIDLLKLVHRCDRWHTEAIDIYDFRNFLEQFSLHNAENEYPNPESADEVLHEFAEVVMETVDLKSWSWDFDKFSIRCSRELANLISCRDQIAKSDAIALVLSRVAWKLPEVFNSDLIIEVVRACSESDEPPSFDSVSSS